MVEHIWTTYVDPNLEGVGPWIDEICIACQVNRYSHNEPARYWYYIIPNQLYSDDRIEPGCIPSLVHLAHKYNEAKHG